MGYRPPSSHVMAWQSDLAGMKRFGARVRADCETCHQWSDVDLDQMIAELGSDRATLWDRHGPCPREACDGVVTYHASPGPGTPSRPLITGDRPLDAPLPIQSMCDGWFGLWATPGARPPDPVPFAERGFTAGDWVRIRALVAGISDPKAPRKLRDLDAPYIVGACFKGDEARAGGKPIARLLGRTILVWRRS